jgi:sigma-B regulation protein RsbU (phosphoserine phosphatase)
MRPRLRQLRVWLERNGLSPKGKLAFMTWYLFGLDLLLFAIQKVAALFRSSFGQSLTGWIIFLSLIVIVFLTVLAARWLSSRLLWRMRNRLLLTSAFIGVIPLILLVGLAGLAFYLFSGQFATYIVTSKLDAELKSLQESNLVIARELAANIDEGHKADISGNKQATVWNDRQLCAWLDGKLLFNQSAPGVTVTAPSLPAYLPSQFARTVRDDDRLFLRSAVTIPTKSGKLTVVSSKPLDQRMLLDVAADLGEVTLFGSGLSLRKVDQNAAASRGVTFSIENPPDTPGERGSKYELNIGATPLKPTFTVGNIPAPTRMLDRQVNFPTAIYVIDWADGDTSRPAGIAVQTRLSALYEHLFSALGYFAPTVEVFLVLAAILFAITEAIAWWIGARLTRSVTGAVAQLYQATTHINRGDFSHRIPVTSNDQLAALASSFNLMTESIEKLIVEQKEKHRLENEITIAQEVQAQLFPRHISQLPSLEVYGFCRPARSVSGDYYDFLTTGSEKLILAVGDVSGKGISAALLMATIHSAVRAYSMEGIPILRQAQAVGAAAANYDPIIPGAEVSPGTLLSLLNHQLYHSTPMEKYATLFLATYDGADRRLTFSNAGHLPPMLLSANGSIRRLEDGGTVVGLFDDIRYDEGSAQLHAGDIFLAYSDGVTEPENDFGEFGEPRLIELVQENRDLPLERIAEIVTAAVDDWIGSAEQPDDVTLVLARAR